MDKRLRDLPPELRGVREGREYPTGKCGKKCMSFRDAHETINIAKRTHSHKRVPKRVYFCDICGTYHTTSKSLKDWQ